MPDDHGRVVPGGAGCLGCEPVECPWPLLPATDLLGRLRNRPLGRRRLWLLLVTLDGETGGQRGAEVVGGRVAVGRGYLRLWRTWVRASPVTTRSTTSSNSGRRCSSPATRSVFGSRLRA
jgi:hypothetical protein